MAWAHVSVAARRRGSAVYYGHDASIIENSNSAQAMTSPETKDGDDAREFRNSDRKSSSGAGKLPRTYLCDVRV